MTTTTFFGLQYEPPEIFIVMVVSEIKLIVDRECETRLVHELGSRVGRLGRRLGFRLILLVPTNDRRPNHDQNMYQSLSAKSTKKSGALQLILYY